MSKPTTIYICSHCKTTNSTGKWSDMSYFPDKDAPTNEKRCVSCGNTTGDMIELTFRRTRIIKGEK